MGQEDLLKMRLVVVAKAVTVQKQDAGCRHFLFQRLPDLLLTLLQGAGIFVDQYKLFGRGQPVCGGRGVACVRQFAQSGDAHGVEFIQVCGRNRQEPQALQKRNAGVLRLAQDPPVEGQPGQFPVHEPVGARKVYAFQRLGGRNWGGQKIGNSRHNAHFYQSL